MEMPSLLRTRRRRPLAKLLSFSDGAKDSDPTPVKEAPPKVREATPPRTQGRVSFLRKTWQQARNANQEQKDEIQNAAEASDEEGDENASGEDSKEEGDPAAQEVQGQDSGKLQGRRNSGSSRKQTAWGSAAALLQGTSAAFKNSRMLVEKVKAAAQQAYQRHVMQKQMRDELEASMKGSADVTPAMEEEIGNILEELQLMHVTDLAGCGEHILNAMIDSSGSLAAMQELRDHLLSHLAALEEIGSTFSGLEKRMEGILEMAAAFNQQLAPSIGDHPVHRVSKLRNSSIVEIAELPAAASAVSAGSSLLDASLEGQDVQDPDSLEARGEEVGRGGARVTPSTSLEAKRLAEVELETMSVKQATVPQAPGTQATVLQALVTEAMAAQAPLVLMGPQTVSSGTLYESVASLFPVTKPNSPSMRSASKEAQEAQEVQAHSGGDRPDGSQQQPLSPEQLQPASKPQLQSQNTSLPPPQPRLLTQQWQQHQEQQKQQQEQQRQHKQLQQQQQQLLLLQQQRQLQQEQEQQEQEQQQHQQQQQPIWSLYELPGPSMHISGEHERYPIRPMWGVASRALNLKQLPLDHEVHVRHAALKAFPALRPPGSGLPSAQPGPFAAALPTLKLFAKPMARHGSIPRSLDQLMRLSMSTSRSSLQQAFPAPAPYSPRHSLLYGLVPGD
ncbi:unnamed protein product [Polarella glacialis]|uniref:Uncharacterized protein n=1 Tax=Polarella glacialis TaxID=89957 RepID=A0A813DPV7_POLGL|nr:unnamed protein product [Polarella glacialis]CAE8723984.1 unnamed protein product [Polarella glacialis]